jgi:hypothetical protein
MIASSASASSGVTGSARPSRSTAAAARSTSGPVDHGVSSIPSSSRGSPAIASSPSCGAIHSRYRLTRSALSSVMARAYQARRPDATYG